VLFIVSANLLIHFFCLLFFQILDHKFKFKFCTLLLTRKNEAGKFDGICVEFAIYLELFCEFSEVDKANEGWKL
jgi:hypothetical protein